MTMPNWVKNAVFYNIYPQSFYDSNADGIGDLNGITAKLDYIKDMGFNAIWLNPFYESSYRDAGYDVTDFYKVGERYGCNADFENLCIEAHKRNIKVCVDLVAGHTSLECEWFKKSCSVEENEYTNRYIWTDSWLNTYNGQCIGGYAKREGSYMKNFFYCQPALNYGFANIDEPEWQLPPEHPACRATKQELINIMEHWLSLGADGFRVDLAPSLIKNDYDGTGITKFWREIRDMFDEKHPECVLIAEWAYPSQAIKAGFHIDFLLHINFPAYTSLFRAEKYRNITREFYGKSFFDTDGNGNIETFLMDYLEEYKKTKDSGFISIPTGNHDLARISYGRTPKELEIIHAFIMTLPGVPFVYYGDEIGMKYNADVPSKEGGFTRTGSRTPMQWRTGKNAGFSEAESDRLYLPVDEDGVNVEEQLSNENSLLNKMKKLIELRKSTPALANCGEIEFLNRKNGGYPLVYTRTSGTDKYLVCLNPLERREEYELCDMSGDIVLSNDDVQLSDSKVVLPPLSYAIIRLV